MEYSDSIEAVASMMEGLKPKHKAYGTVVYQPTKDISVVDFGKERWPPPFQKQKVCSRILLIANWTDARFAMVGGEANQVMTFTD